MLGVPEKVQKKVSDDSQQKCQLDGAVWCVKRCCRKRHSGLSTGKTVVQEAPFNPINVQRYVIHERGNRKGSCVHVSAGEHGEHWPG